jgi:phenylalanine-4-hydroxylase
MQFVSRYVSHQPDEQGYIIYSTEEHAVWSHLFNRQQILLPNRACDQYLKGLKILNLSAEQIPQLPEISKCLQALTGWKIAPVAALISAREFFTLLSERKFPAATFIRTREEIDYVKEPDIFHEIFGHCPMLTDPIYADFIHDYACKVLTFPETEWALLQRLFWFTVEFGLILTPEGVRAYGGGILSSTSETVYSVESDIPLRILFDPITAFRMPYRIDMLQKAYFVINDYRSLYEFVKLDISKLLAKAHSLGELPPLFPFDKNNPNIHIHAC